jgi:hypothetical protein
MCPGVELRAWREKPGCRGQRPGRTVFSPTIPLFLVAALLTVCAYLSAASDPGHYLLMQPIQDALGKRKFTLLKEISEKKISINLESPFDLNGYVSIDKFIDDLTPLYSQFEARIEWGSKQLEEQFAVQSLILVLKDRRSEKTIYYKLIFFFTKKDEKWKMYYLRGLKV